MMPYLVTYAKATAIAVALVVLAGCGRTQASQDSLMLSCADTLSFCGSYNKIAGNNAIDVSYVPLYEDDRHLVRNVDKLIVNGNGIFMFDKLGTNTLLRHSPDGKFQVAYGSKGGGPDEYVRLWDFDVFGDSVYLYDLNTKKIQCYAIDGTLMGSKVVIDFEPEHFIVLPNGGFMFSTLYPGAGSQVIITDEQMQVVRRILPYVDGQQNDKMTHTVFQRLGDKIVYHRPINDTVYLLSQTGDIEQRFVCDFNGNNMPERLQKSYELVSKEDAKAKYTFLTEAPIFTVNLVIGEGYAGGSKATFMYDFNQNNGGWKSFNEPRLSHSDIFHPMYATGDSIVTIIDGAISSYYTDIDEVPNRVRQHLDNGDKAIVYFHIK